MNANRGKYEHRQHGFTLVEIMVVIAIVGILSAIGAGALSQIVINARIRGAATSVSQMMTDARALSVTQHCPHFVQINGTGYAPTGAPAGMVTTRAAISLVRKGNCASTNYFFETNANPLLTDKVLQTQVLGEPLMPNNGLQIAVTAPSGVVASNLLTVDSIAIGYATDGARNFATDTGSGFANDNASNASNSNFTFVFRHVATDTNMPSLTVPNASTPSLTRWWFTAPRGATPTMLATVLR